MKFFDPSNDEDLANEISRLLNSNNTIGVLDEILNHSLSIDYFNVYLSLPIFGQRVLCDRHTHQFDFDPPARLSNEQIKQWLVNHRLKNYINSDIYLESLLSLLLNQTEDLFDTVIDVQQFHQFLQTTTGIKYWNFSLDSLRRFRSINNNQNSTRIDTSFESFRDKYFSQQTTKMINHRKHANVWLEEAIHAIRQIQSYWLIRYRNQILPKPVRTKRKPVIKSNHVSLSEHIDTISIQKPMTDETSFVQHNLGNMSYIDYNPGEFQYFPMSEEESLDFNETHQDVNTEIQDKQQIPATNQSIEDYAVDANVELFYRILISDSLAGSPFYDYLSNEISKFLIQFLRDAEILFSISKGTFRERILRRFINNYLSSMDIVDSIFDKIDEEKSELIQELKVNEPYDNPLLWKYQLKITKILIPSFLDYIKFDRLCSLIQGTDLSTNSIVDFVRQYFPSINFEAFSSTNDFVRQSNRVNCIEDLSLFLPNRYNTREKLIHTDEQCEHRSGQLNPNIYSNDMKIVLGSSFNVPITSKSIDNNTFLSTRILHKIDEQISSLPQAVKLNEIEDYTNEIMHSALHLIEIDRFVTNLIDDSLQQIQTTHSTPLSPVFDEILLTDSYSSSIQNNNAYDSSELNTLLSQTIRFAQHDACHDAQLVSYHENLSVLSNTSYQELLRLLSNQIPNHHWPLNEYIGYKGQRAWHAMKLAADIANLDPNLTLNYHQLLDWIPTDNNLGSFNPRTSLIVRRLQRIHGDI